MTQSRDPWARRPSPPRRDRLRTWITIGAPVIALIAVVSIGLIGRSVAPPATPSPATGLVADQATLAAAASTRTPPVAPTITAPSDIAPVAEPCTPLTIPFDSTGPIDLTGTWAGDDGGVYYVRQHDGVIWWNGMSDRSGPVDGLGRAWNNVGRGVLKDDLSIDADWADVPRGGVGGYGTVVFQVIRDANGGMQIAKTKETGTGRGDSLWWPCKLGFIR